MSTLLIEKPQDLDGFEVLEDNLITYDAEYWQWQQITKAIYDQLTRAYPWVEARPYQYKYAAMFACRHRNIMAWQMSSGKTITSAVMLAAIYDKLDEQPPGVIQIAVPTLLAAERWKEDMNLLPQLQNRFTIVKKAADLQSECPIFIYTYDFPKRKLRDRVEELNPTISGYLADHCRPETLIIDEVHGLKEKTARTTSMTVLCNVAKRVLVLSGTLSDGQLSRVHNICRMVYGEAWPFSTSKGMTSYLGKKQKVQSNYLTGTVEYSNAPPRYLQQLDVSKMSDYYELSRRFIHRLTLNDPDVEPYITIPESKTEVHIVEPNETQYARYRNAVDMRRGTLQAIASSNRSASMRGQALQILRLLIGMCNWPALPESPKIQAVKEIVKSADGKVIVFAHHVDAARRITTELEKDFHTVRLFANDEQLGQKMSDEQRVRTVNDFQYVPDVKVGVFSINLANEAIDLTAASDVVYYDLTWQPIKLMQSMSRAVRPGNKHSTVKLHYVAHQGMIDEHQLYLMLEKVKGARLLLDYDMAAGMVGTLDPIDAIKRILHAN